MHTDLRDHGFVMNGVLAHHKQPVAAKCKFVMDPGPDSSQNRVGVLGPATKSGRRFGSSHKIGQAFWVQPQSGVGVVGPATKSDRCFGDSVVRIYHKSGSAFCRFAGSLYDCDSRWVIPDARF